MKILFVLPGLHRHNRGAETAFIAIASELAKLGNTVTLMGSGPTRAGVPYRYMKIPSLARENFESFPSIPPLRSEYVYEELTFVPGLLSLYRPMDYDVTLTCSYPFINWCLRRPVLRGSRPPHVFVTQNADWPAYDDQAEYRFFGCDGLVCINPEFFERNKDHWRCVLIPNGVDCNLFRPGGAQRQVFGLPEDRPVVLMVSALIPNKRVDRGVAAVSRIPHAHLVVAGDGPLRHNIDALASRLLPGRFSRITVAPEQMSALYKSADVFLHLAKEESFGNIYLEALACGIPIVAHDSPRLRWIVGEHAFLADTENEAVIAQQITRARNVSPAQRQSGVSRAQNFSWPKIGQMYQAFLQVVVGSIAPSGN